MDQRQAGRRTHGPPRAVEYEGDSQKNVSVALVPVQRPLWPHETRVPPDQDWEKPIEYCEYVELVLVA
jgi:hypothetical protein